MNGSRRYATVAVSGPLRQTFTYHMADNAPPLSPGQRLLVPFGRTRKVGFFVSATEKPTFATRSVERVLDEESFFNGELFSFCRWVSEYYFANLADCLTAALPGVLKLHRPLSYRWADIKTDRIPPDLQSVCKPGGKLPSSLVMQIRNGRALTLSKLMETGLVLEEFSSPATSKPPVIIQYKAEESEKWPAFFARRSFKPDPFSGLRSRACLRQAGWTDHFIRLALKHSLLIPVETAAPDRILEFVEPRQDVASLTLTNEQQTVVDSVTKELDRGFRTFLLHGITGSGKTLVYCHLAQATRRLGREVLVLTPEISLSSAVLAYFRGFFEKEVTVIHSAMSGREHFESWSGIRRGVYHIVVGPRSAVFAPLRNIGLIIVDEEHDGSYKQNDPAPRFHGRDAAIMRAKMAGIPVVLGSASPSVESYYHARCHQYHLLQLTRRPATARLPLVKIVDLSRHQVRGEAGPITLPLKRATEHQLDTGRQVILFLNRRGYAPQLKCRRCGHIPECPHCAVRLTYHRAGRKLVCHYCGHIRLGYDECEKCRDTEFFFQGTGTQKLEDMIPRLIESARVARFDSDTASGRQRAHRILSAFAAGQHNILLGTQMVTKGLDLSGVSLVGVLLADQGLDLPDFRAEEKTFARLLQVAGRSGRAQTRGKVIIQTYYPDHRVIKAAAGQDYASFYETEIALREQFYYPPFCRIVNVILSSPHEKSLAGEIERFTRELEQRLKRVSLEAEVLGPAPCPIPYLRKRFRYHLLVKTMRIVRLVRLLTQWEAGQARFGLKANVRIAIDVDPVEMM